MKILISNVPYFPYQYGGAERSVAFLAESLVHAGHSVAVVTIHPELYDGMEMVNGVRVYRVAVGLRYWPYGRAAKPGIVSRALWHIGDVWNGKAGRSFGAILDLEQPDVVHTNVIAGFSAAVWKQVKRRNIRLVHTLRDYYVLCGRSSLIRGSTPCKSRCLECRILTYRRMRAAKLIDAVGSNSDYVLQCHEQHHCFPNAQKSVIYNIVKFKPAVLPPLRKNPEEARDLIFGFIGRVEAAKGIEVVLQAVGLLKHAGWRLRIAGSGTDEYVATLRAAYTDQRIEWLGFADSMEFYSSIHVLLVPSIWAEPLPRTLIEGIASGKTAICAESGGIAEIAHLGAGVETYPATDVKKLAQLMDGALEEPSRWHQGGWKSVDNAALFSEPVITARYLELYEGKA